MESTVSKYDVALELVKTATVAVQIKTDLLRRDIRRTKARNLHYQLVEKTESELIKALVPFFQRQASSIASGIEKLGKADDDAKSIVADVYDPEEWTDELIGRSLPVLAVGMARAAIGQFLVMGVDVRRSIKRGSGPREKFNPHHGPDGKFATGGGYYSVTRDKDGVVLHGGKPDQELTVRAKQLRVPPAWTGLKMSVDPKNDLQVVGNDAKGRAQYIYSAEHGAKSSAEKFGRVKALIKELPKIDSAVSKDAPHKDEAAVLLLMRKTGIRIGSETDTKAEKQAYGATTLTKDHVKIHGDTVTLSFVGKKGVQIDQSIKDKELAAVLSARLSKKKGGEKIFDTTDAKVREYLHSKDGVFKPKDLRTVKAAEIALSTLKTIPEPKSEREFAKARNAVGDAVSSVLGNTRSVALSAYIPPEVFAGWKSKLGIKSAVGDVQSELEEWADSIHYAGSGPDGEWDDDPSLSEEWWDVPNTQKDPDDEISQEEKSTLSGWQKFNPHHDQEGRFASSGGRGSSSELAFRLADEVESGMNSRTRIRAEHGKDVLDAVRRILTDREIATYQERRESIEKLIGESNRTLQEKLPPAEYELVRLRGMLQERTPAEVQAYTEAAVSWQSHDPSNAAVNHAVEAFQSAGISMQQRGQNNSYYGITPNGLSVRIANHLGFETHDIELIFREDKPSKRQQVQEDIDEALANVSIGKSVPHIRTKSTTASEWLENHPDDLAQFEEMLLASGVEGVGILTELPESMKRSILEKLAESFGQDYWDDISVTTAGNAETILKEGLQSGWSIADMAKKLRESLGGTQYARTRAFNIARTESGNALNGARKSVLDDLMADLGPEVPMKPTWLSVLGTTTRDTHANLDGVPADSTGMWTLSGYKIPYPGHYSLPARERCNCQCSLTAELGMGEGDATQLIQEYYDRMDAEYEEKRYFGHTGSLEEV